ncbi:ABC transporter permease subunit [Limnobacter humi]|uniref:ABC transporter permease subunit n=1 Tax=Limnobacter humi TaxID=1778671 RepID=A0ABT1WDT8_9BURK|nr:ABC transporter permease subunit [Limnobacter humi]
MSLNFLLDPAGFSLSEGWLALGYTAPYWQVFLNGLLNTLKVALPALALAVVLGFSLGFGLLSQNPVWRRTARVYVDGVRNVPLLLQVLALYFGASQWLPVASEAWALPGGVLLSKSGLALPTLVSTAQGWGVQWPHIGRFAVEGGWVLSPEYLALLLALGLYTAAFVAELVKAGVLSVRPGMAQAALALGLTPAQARRWVVRPLALRAMLPPLANQVLNLLKNASLGVAIGYPELVSVANTSMNQSGKATECMVLVLVMYALLSAVAAGCMAVLNQRAMRGSA